MARRRRTSTAEDFVDVIALMPWWAGVALAIVFYLALHWYAEQPLPAATKPGQLGPALTQVVFRAFAKVGQYVAPLICLVGAALSVWRRRKRANSYGALSGPGMARTAPKVKGPANLRAPRLLLHRMPA